MVLKIIIKEAINKNKILFNENIQLKNFINNLQRNINNYENKIKLLETEIQRYKSNFNNFNNFYNQTDKTLNILKPKEKIMAINFVSLGIQDIGHYCLPCKNTDLFVRLEEKLNNDFPLLKDREAYFEVNGRRLKRFKTLDENKIKSNDIINVFLIDEQN